MFKSANRNTKTMMDFVFVHWEIHFQLEINRDVTQSGRMIYPYILSCTRARVLTHSPQDSAQWQDT